MKRPVDVGHGAGWLPWLLSASLILGALPARSAESRCGPLQPFEAHYAMTRNDKALGETTIRLEALADGRWRYRLDTRADRGAVGLLGAKVSGNTEFRFLDDRPVPLAHRSRQKLLLVKRNESIEFDWKAHQALARKGSDRWTLPLQGGEVDPLLVNVAVMLDVSGSGPLSYQLVDFDEIETQRFERLDRRTVSTPLGVFEATGLARVHRNPKRQTRSWHSPAHQQLAVLIEQIKPDGETLTMRLKGFRLLPCDKHAATAR